MSPEFSVEINAGENDHIKIVHLQGELDEMSIETLENQLDSHLKNTDVHQIIFDLSKLRFINSKGIGYLVSIHSHLAKDGRSMILCTASQPVMDVISLVGLTNIVPYYPTIEEATNQET